MNPNLRVRFSRQLCGNKAEAQLCHVYVFTHLSARRSHLNIHVASSPEAFHWSAEYICLAGIWVRCRRVLDRIPLASSAHVEETVIRKQYRCCSDHHHCLQRRGTPPPLGGFIFGVNDE
jgi:hypothetical protein